MSLFYRNLKKAGISAVLVSVGNLIYELIIRQVLTDMNSPYIHYFPVCWGIWAKNLTGVLSGPGAYGRTIPREILTKIMKNPEQKKDFLDFCYRYDSNPYVCGMGKDNLLAASDIRQE